jgi:hypothetical protein
MMEEETQPPSEERLRQARADGADTKLCNQARYRNPYSEEEDPELWRAWEGGYADAGF